MRSVRDRIGSTLIASPRDAIPRQRHRWPIRMAVVSGLLLVIVMPAFGASEPPVVGVYTVSSQSYTVTTRLPGRVVVYRKAEIRPQVDGIIQKRLFKAGAHVEAGQTLYRIDPSRYKAAVAEARAAVAEAKARLQSARPAAERAQRLYEANAISEEKLDSALAALAAAEARLASARAQRQAARIDLGDTTIKAPIGGRIGTTAVTVGGLVNAYQSQALTTVRQIHPVYVDIQLSQDRYAQFRQARASGRLKSPPEGAVRIYVMAGRNSVTPLPGKLIFTSASVNPDTGSVNLRAAVKNPNEILLPGMFVRVKLIVGVDSDAILLPQQAVQRAEDGQPYCFVVNDNGTAKRRSLEIAAAADNRWRITDGLKPGVRVIVQGVDKVGDGETVESVAVAPDASGTFVTVDKATDRGA